MLPFVENVPGFDFGGGAGLRPELLEVAVLEDVLGRASAEVAVVLV
jgi:hypothetical protein